MTLRKNLESASVKLKSATSRLDAILANGRGAHAEWASLIGEVREASAAIQEAERRAAGVKPDRN